MTEIRGHVGEWAAVLVSVVAAVVAIWQARIAQRQAVSADTAARLAERQATAAESQVQIMREQLDAENDERIDSRRPQFEVTASRVKDAGQNQPHAELTLTQTAGRALRQVTVQAAGEYVEGFRSGRADEWGLHSVAGEAVIDGMSPGGRVTSGGVV
ncbi:hypothetical protein [Streptomyces yanii]|uniref:Uncharacterized protein n=1 Tax=Streptomyces yanii TaxID=78510 RepID=A0ABV5RMS4_9ACTN